jgi:hypothetical protein
VDDLNFWKLALALAAPLCFYFGFRNWKLARLIDDTPRSRVRSAAQGYVELGGRASLPANTENHAPLSNRPCVWWLFRIEHVTGSGKDRRWETINRGVSTALFMLEDEGASCLVNPQGADVRPAEKSTWYGMTPWPMVGPADAAVSMLNNREYRYIEHRIYEHELVNVIGDFRTLGGIKSTDATGEVMKLLAEWKQDQSALLQHFDTNHDGVLSLAEWELARAAARRQIEAQPPQPSTPNLNVLVRPQDKRPFLIAACDLRKLAWRIRMVSAGLIAAFLLMVGVLASLLLNPS